MVDSLGCGCGAIQDRLFSSSVHDLTNCWKKELFACLVLEMPHQGATHAAKLLRLVSHLANRPGRATLAARSINSCPQRHLRLQFGRDPTRKSRAPADLLRPRPSSKGWRPLHRARYRRVFSCVSRAFHRSSTQSEEFTHVANGYYAF